MDGRHARRLEDVADRVPALTKVPAPTAQTHSGGLTSGWALLLGVGWPLAYALGLALEPAPAHPHGSVPLLVAWASTVLFFGLIATIAAATIRNRAAAIAGVVTGVVAVTMSAACPVSGHHSFGMWWVAQFAAVTFMLGASVAAMRSPHT